MAQHDYVIANGTGAAVRSDLNGALAAIVTQNSGATAPATTYAYQWWADTTTGLLKLRNAANNAWITLFQLDGEWSTLAVENGSASAPSIYFKDSGTDTGIYSPGADQVAVATNGTGRLFVNSSGLVGIGTSSPGNILHVTPANSSGASATDGVRVSAGTSSVGINFGANSSGTFGWIQSSNAGVAFAPTVINPQGGNVGIGTTAPTNKLVVSDGGNGGFEVAPGASDIQTYSYNRGTSAYITHTDLASAFIWSNGTNERFRCDTSGRLLVGTSSARSNFFNGLNLAPAIQVEGTSGGRMLSVFSNNDDGGVLILGRQGGSTPGGNTLVANGNEVGLITFQASDGTDPVDCARIQAIIDGTPGANDMPGRLVFSTTADGASSPTERMRLNSSGNLSWGAASPSGYPGLNFLASNGLIVSQTTYGSGTASAANLNIASDGVFYRSTSSIKYKTNVESIEDSYSDALLNCRPVWYQSTCEADKPGWGYWGFIAEEVAEIDPRLCFFKEEENGTLEPEGVQYDRFVPHLLNLIKRQGEAIAELQAEVAALKAQ